MTNPTPTQAAAMATLPAKPYTSLEEMMRDRLNNTAWQAHVRDGFRRAKAAGHVS